MPLKNNNFYFLFIVIKYMPSGQNVRSGESQEFNFFMFGIEG